MDGAAVAQVVEARDDGCVVRCLSGEVAAGTTFPRMITPDGETIEVELRVVEIWKYTRATVPAIDRGHSALLVLSGTGLAEPYAECRLVGR